MVTVSTPHGSSRPRNQLLAALSRNDLALLQPHLRRFPLAVKADIERPNRRIEAVCFMETGIASVVAVQADETQVEVGLIGYEGMSGTAVVLGGDQSPIRPTFRSRAPCNGSAPVNYARLWMRASPCVACCSDMFKSSWCRQLTPPSRTLGLTSTSVWRDGF